jgi:alpha-glucosidase
LAVQWDDTANAGFSTAAKTWLPVSSLYPSVNVKIQQTTANSHLNIYKELIKLKKEDFVKSADTFVSTVFQNGNVLYFQRIDAATNKTLVTLANFGSNVEQFNFTQNAGAMWPQDIKMKYHIVSDKSSQKMG